MFALFRRWQNVLLAIVLVLVLAVFGVQLWQSARFLVAGQRAVGRVLEVRSQPAGLVHGTEESGGTWPRYRHHVDYEFLDAAGTRRTGSLDVETRHAAAVPYRVGGEIPVQYLRADPGTSRLAGVSLDLWPLALILAVGAGIVAAAVWLGRHESLPAALARLGGLLRWPRRRGRQAWPEGEPFPPAWLHFLRRNVGAYRLLTPAEQERLHGDMRAFIADKRWEGCAGLQVTEDMKVTIAGQACLLLLGLDDHDGYASVRTVLVYPSGYRHPEQAVSPGGVVNEGGTHILGEAWYRGPVVLAWDEVLAGGRDPADGRNVVYHEFAHQLDFTGTGAARGPQSADPEQRRRWREVMSAEYAALRQAAGDGTPTLLDTYGATNEAEFFAVATEAFLERPVPMRQRHPALYEVLRDYYGQDPAAWFTRAGPAGPPSGAG